MLLVLRWLLKSGSICRGVSMGELPRIVFISSTRNVIYFCVGVLMKCLMGRVHISYGRRYASAITGWIYS